jgi:hypothetical protein
MPPVITLIISPLVAIEQDQAEELKNRFEISRIRYKKGAVSMKDLEQSGFHYHDLQSDKKDNYNHFLFSSMHFSFLYPV